MAPDGVRLRLQCGQDESTTSETEVEPPTKIEPESTSATPTDDDDDQGNQTLFKGNRDGERCHSGSIKNSRPRHDDKSTVTSFSKRRRRPHLATTGLGQWNNEDYYGNPSIGHCGVQIQ